MEAFAVAVIPLAGATVGEGVAVGCAGAGVAVGCAGTGVAVGCAGAGVAVGCAGVAVGAGAFTSMLRASLKCPICSSTPYVV